MKMRRLVLVGPLLLMFALACSDNPTANKTLVPHHGSYAITPAGTLDQNIIAILALLPKGLETAATTRWGNIKAKYNVGLTDPSQMAVARQMLFELTPWVMMKAPTMDAPINNEAKGSAAARAVLYMALYIYNGPGTPPPSFNPGADAVVGLVTPGAAATVVTPTGHAGVQLDAGSVAENTIIVVRQNLNRFADNCTGPLQTLLCQYPQFYSFDEFPHTRLLKGAKFSVCHVNEGTFRAPLGEGIHDRFRLAHTLPASPADYTPGSTIRNTNGESIEILPLVTQNFVHCEVGGVDYVPEPELIGFLPRMGRALASLFTPKTAYAIDQGGGGFSFAFSDFNDVDSVGRPDRAVQSFTATPACGDCSVQAGTHLLLNYTIANIGQAATGDGAPGYVQLVQQNLEGPPTVYPLAVFQVGQLYPGGTPFTVTNQDVVIPDVPSGNYTIEITVGIGFFNEIPADLANNHASIPITIGPPPIT